jgi:hypothetical protein
MKIMVCSEQFRVNPQLARFGLTKRAGALVEAGR